MFGRAMLRRAVGCGVAATAALVTHRACHAAQTATTLTPPPPTPLPRADPAKAAPKLPADRPLVVVITGVTSGMGLALAKEFKARGHTVIGCARREDRLAELQAEFGAPHQFLKCDISSEPSTASFAQALKSSGTPIDMVIANAGGHHLGLPWDVPPADFRRVIDVNVNGSFYTTHFLLPLLMEQAQQEGAPLKRLINISSGAAHVTNHIGCAYSSSKWAVEALSKCTAQALRHAGLQDKVLCVPFSPGIIASEMNKMPWAHDAAEWAPQAVSFMLAIEPSQSGASLTMAAQGFYSDEYTAHWFVPDGQPIGDFMVAPH